MTHPESDLQSTSTSEPTLATRLRNFLVVIVAICLSVAIVLGFQTKTTTVSLETLAKESTPLDVALVNAQPSLVEFYANWCTSCQAMAGDMHQLQQTYGDRVNFVMLNVDNTKWLPEMLHYRVDGIPHFVFLDDQAEAIASVIGEQPRLILADNLEALINHAPLPHIPDRGQVSNVTNAPASPRPDDPRSHGSQVEVN